MSRPMPVEARTLVHADARAIFALYEDVAHWHTWDPDTREASLDGPLRVGAQGRLIPTRGRGVPMRVTEVVVDRSFTVESRIPLFRMVFEHELLPGGHGTEVIHRVTFSGPLALVLGPMLKRQLMVGLPITLANLKRMAERGGATPPSHPPAGRPETPPAARP